MLLDANAGLRIVGEEVASGPGGVEVFPLGSSAGITAVGLLAMPASSIIAKAPITSTVPWLQTDAMGLVVRDALL
jgi:hypothetical protein